MIKAITFDWGGVIVKSKPILPGIAAILGIPKEDVYKIYFENNHLANVDGMSYEDLWFEILKKLGQPDKIEQVWAHMKVQQTFIADQQMLDLITKLRKNGYKTGMLSNNTKKIGENIKQEGLDKYFDTFLISAEIGYQKPDPRAFEVLFSKLGVEPHQAVYIDDSEKSLTTAEEIGYSPILFTSYQPFLESLISLGVKVD